MLRVGETAKVLHVTPGNVPAMITCTSENPGVATVGADGIITVIAPGSAIISGTLAVDGSEKAFRFEINVWAESIQSLNIQSSIGIGETVTMRAQPLRVSSPISWSVSNTDLAEINTATGVITGKKAGRLKLVAQASDLKREWAVTIRSAANGPAQGSVTH